ncbi:MAG TPA: hypothetical protein VGE13_01240 [Candidatus Saccharimonadales bacterium]
MYPNQQPNGQPPQDPPQLQPIPDQSQFDSSYLDQIAAPVQQKQANPLMLWGLIGGVLLAVIIFMMVLLSSGAPSPSKRVADLLSRTQSLKEVTQDSAKKIKDSKLRAANSSLASILSGMENDFTTYLSSTGGSKPESAKDGPIAEEFTTLSEKLEDARLNERFDTVYAREVGYQIKQIRSDFTIIYKSVKSKSFQDVLIKQDKSLEDLSSDFSTFNSN